MAEKKIKHDPVRAIAIDAIGLAEAGKYNSEEAILITTEKKKLTSLDKRFIRQLVNGVIKMKRRLDHDIRFFLSRPSEKLPHRLKNILRLGYFQLYFTDRIPAAAAVSESVNLAHHFLDSSRARMVNAVLRNMLRKPERIVFRDRDKDPVGYLGDFYSYPDWFVKYCLDEFRFDQTQKLLDLMNKPPIVSFRVNRFKASHEEVEQILDDAEIGYIKGSFLKDFYRLDSAGFPLEEELIKSGKIYIQDESTGLSVNLLDLEDGMKVLDMAAAPGGKSIYAAQLMHNTGLITAIDKSRPRLELLVQNSKRLGVDNLVPVLADSMEFKGGPFDRVLVDVPCSGWGNAGRHSDLRWSKTDEDIDRMSRMQARMIDVASRNVKPGGILVYSTCTIIRKENDQIIEEFLLRNPMFKLIDASSKLDKSLVTERGFVKTYPNKEYLSGAFCAALQKTDKPIVRKSKKSKNS